jgi:two-component system, OmpR family, response regulator
MAKLLTRITYVEDEPDIRIVAQIALVELGGFTVDVCGSGAEALERAPTFDPELFVLDVMMPSWTASRPIAPCRPIRGSPGCQSCS